MSHIQNRSLLESCDSINEDTALLLKLIINNSIKNKFPRQGNIPCESPCFVFKGLPIVYNILIKMSSTFGNTLNTRNFCDLWRFDRQAT